MKIYRILFLLIIHHFGYSQKLSNGNEETMLTQTFVSQWHNFTIKYPLDWTVQKYPDDNNLYFIGTLIDSAGQAQDGAFLITVFATKEERTSEYEFNKNMSILKADSSFQDFKIQSEEEILVDGKKAMRVVFTAKYQNTETISLQYYLTVGKKLFAFGGTFPGSYLGEFEVIFDQIIHSMSFK